MISITRLYCGIAGTHDQLRYPSAAQRVEQVRPVIVWNSTRRCNLSCGHCYADSAPRALAGNELSTSEARGMIDDLASFGCPVLLFSGGEPLMREDLAELVEHAAGYGIRTAISTNGLLITPKTARILRVAGLAYAGISIDGDMTTHDRLRGEEGAYWQAMRGVRVAREAGIKVGLRHTLTRESSGQIGHIFHLLDREGLYRVCFYHLVPSGRGGALTQLDHTQTRQAVNEIIDLAKQLARIDSRKEVLTVDNHTDGVWLYLRLLRENPAQAEAARALLLANGGNRSGSAIACIGWDGTVYPDQFWRTQPLGNIRQRNFCSIWQNSGDGLLSDLKLRACKIVGRCAACAHINLCNGNLRARAEALGGDLWASDPGCYLTDAELASQGSEERQCQL